MKWFKNQPITIRNALIVAGTALLIFLLSPVRDRLFPPEIKIVTRDTATSENLYEQPIIAGAADVELTISAPPNPSWNQTWRGTSRGHSEYKILFCKGEKVLLAMSSTQLSHRAGNAKMFIAGNFRVSPTPTEVLTGKTLSFLKEVDNLKIRIIWIRAIQQDLPQKNREVIEGNIVCTFNNSVLITLPIPRQNIETVGEVPIILVPFKEAHFSKI